MDTISIQRFSKPKEYPKIVIPPRRKPFLAVHGNVMYDYFYQSHTDTPYMDKELHQHTLQTVLDITIKDQYPFHIAFNTSKGSSAYFRNITGLNLQYTNRDFRNTIIRKARDWDAGNYKQLGELKQIKDSLDKVWAEVNKLRGWFTDPSWKQQMVEAKERELYSKAPAKTLPAFPGIKKWAFPGLPAYPSLPERKLPADSSLLKLEEQYNSKKRVLDSLQQKLAILDKKHQRILTAISTRKTQMAELLTGAKNNRELADKLGDMGLPDTVLPKGYKTLLAVKSFGIGRTMVDYSELTVKNVSIMGFQAEYNPSYYVAFATGSVDYRFRDFIVNQNRVRQYVNIARVGFGMREGNNIILSVYGGKKQVYNFNTSTPGNGPVEVPDYRIMGMSLEGKWLLSKHHSITGEIAKSSTPYFIRTAGHENQNESMLRFSDHSNEAYAVTANSYIPSAGTRLTGMYKLMGANFQSFSLYATGNKQNAWMLKADQPFFKKQLMISASIRKNVFASQFENAGYQSSTVFKSIQATFRKKHWPVISVGYYPSSQLMKLSEDKYIENLFYTLVGTVNHLYAYRGTSMNTMFSGTRFYNKQTDSNFVYFNSTNLLLNQTVFLGRLTLNGGLSSAMNREYAIHGVDGNLQYRAAQWLEFGGGLKYNYQTVYRLKQLGYTANIKVLIPWLGEVALMTDKGFVPGAQKQLVSNNTGRLTYTKIF